MQMFHHILTREREVFWQYGEVTCAAFSLKNLDTVRTKVVTSSGTNISVASEILLVGFHIMQTVASRAVL